jgi:hypothetical protein
VSRRRSLALTAAAVALFAACSGAPSDYGKASEEVFMRSCTAGGGGGNLDDVCRCSYDRIAAEIPYEDFKRYDQQLQKDENDIPDALVTIISACAAGDGTTTTTEG